MKKSLLHKTILKKKILIKLFSLLLKIDRNIEWIGKWERSEIIVETAI